jgi:divalent metal cation (Fe/Co/Zn/Cd) transporter
VAGQPIGVSIRPRLGADRARDMRRAKLLAWAGIGLAAVTAPTMPLLARAKRRVGGRLGSSATVSEGAQNMLCAYLSVALVAGLGANAAFGWWWADPVTALAIAGVAAREGRQSWRGEACCDAC